MWTNDDIAEVLEHLRVQGNDDARFEAKSCARTIGTSVWESVSAFANTKGGVLLLGISEDGGFLACSGIRRQPYCITVHGWYGRWQSARSTVDESSGV